MPNREYSLPLIFFPSWNASLDIVNLALKNLHPVLAFYLSLNGSYPRRFAYSVPSGSGGLNLTTKRVATCGSRTRAGSNTVTNFRASRPFTQLNTTLLEDYIAAVLSGKNRCRVPALKRRRPARSSARTTLKLHASIYRNVS